MASLAQQKAALRKTALERRAKAHGAGAAQSSYLSGVLSSYRGVPLAGYRAMRTEIDPVAAMTEAAAFGPVGLPVVTGPGQPLVFHHWTPDAAMTAGHFGADVPAMESVMLPEILIVPLVAFDLQGGRLGYGGGFYDRTLAMLRRNGPVLAIGFAFADQQAEGLPQEATDQPLDMIVTERGVIAL